MSTKRANASLKEAPTKANSTSQMLARAVHAAICVSSFSLAVSTAKQILTPLFGSVATNLFLQKAVLTTTVVLSLLPSRQSALALGAVLALAPVAFHQIGSRTSRMKDPVFGPIVAYMSILAPVAWLTVGAVKGALVSWLCFVTLATRTHYFQHSLNPLRSPTSVIQSLYSQASELRSVLPKRTVYGRLYQYLPYSVSLSS